MHWAGQGKLESLGTKVEPYHLNLLSVHFKRPGHFVTARKIVRASFFPIRKLESLLV